MKFPPVSVGAILNEISTSVCWWNAKWNLQPAPLFLMQVLGRAKFWLVSSDRSSCTVIFTQGVQRIFFFLHCVRAKFWLVTRVCWGVQRIHANFNHHLSLTLLLKSTEVWLLFAVNRMWLILDGEMHFLNQSNLVHRIREIWLGEPFAKIWLVRLGFADPCQLQSFYTIKFNEKKHQGKINFCLFCHKQIVFV